MREARLPDAEWELLALLRDRGEATAAELRAGLRREVSHATVSTLLERLAAKRLVARRRAPQGKAFVFRATAAASGAVRKRLRALLASAFSGRASLLVASLLGDERLSLAEARELRAIVELHAARASERADEDGKGQP